MSRGGSEQSVLHVVASDGSGEVVAPLPNCPHATVCWLPDSSALYVQRLQSDEMQSMEMRVVLLRMDGGVVELPRPAGLPQLVFPQLSRDGRHLALRSGLVGDLRPTHIADLHGDGEFRPFLADARVAYAGDIAGDAYYAVTTDGAPRGQLVRIPLATPGDRSTWTVVLPGSDAVLRGVALAGDGLVVVELVDASTRIRLIDFEGNHLAEVPLPPAGNADASVAQPDGDELVILHQGFASSPSILRYDVRSGALETLVAPRMQLDGVDVERAAATAGDGTQVPYWVVRARGDATSGAVARPALIHGYGGFNTPMLPHWSGAHSAFVLAGGTLIVPNLRGGGEFGQEWWAGGRFARKRQTFDDLFAVAEDAIARGLTTPQQLAMWGASNGGLLAGAAVAHRPDLFAAVFCAVPVLDMMHIMRDPFTAEASRSDYGDPHDAQMAPVMLAYSPYHNLREGIAYPATLVAAGENDVRCRPWHSRKFVARLQRAGGGDRPALLRTWAATGHGTGRSARSDVEQMAEWLGFVMRHTGLAPVAATASAGEGR
jgi:prolyl oligopeptidase